MCKPGGADAITPKEGQVSFCDGITSPKLFVNVRGRSAGVLRREREAQRKCGERASTCGRPLLCEVLLLNEETLVKKGIAEKLHEIWNPLEVTGDRLRETVCINFGGVAPRESTMLLKLSELSGIFLLDSQSVLHA